MLSKTSLFRMMEGGQIWSGNPLPDAVPGVLCQLQGSEGFLQGCSQRGFILQHLTQDRTWQLQQHTWNTQTEDTKVTSIVQICFIMSKK